MKPVLVSHPTGNSFVRALLHGLNERGLLHSFHTTLGFSSQTGSLSQVPAALQRQLKRRSFDLPPEKLHCHPVRESLRLLVQAGGGAVPLPKALSVDAVYRSLDHQVAHDARNLPSIGAVYCYEDGALDTFVAAKSAGLACFYDLPIAYYKATGALLAEEAERLPEWKPTLLAPDDPPEKLQRKDEELALADVVFCPSDFVLKSLPNNVRNSIQCVVAPFGSPDSVPPRAKAAGSGEKLRVLFAGSMSQRKGLADLFQAMQLLDDPAIELIVMGQPLAPMSFYREHCRDFVWERPRPQWEVFELMSTCDVLVLPSIIEGRALVQQEAMMCGLPIIVTENAGGAELIEEGRTGFIVPIRSPQSIAEKIAWCASNRSRLNDMSGYARDKAAQCTWAAYEEKIVSSIIEYMSGR